MSASRLDTCGSSRTSELSGNRPIEPPEGGITLRLPPPFPPLGPVTSRIRFTVQILRECTATSNQAESRAGLVSRQLRHELLRVTYEYSSILSADDSTSPPSASVLAAAGLKPAT